VMAFFYLITLTILWNGACEQLEYSEY